MLEEGEFCAVTVLGIQVGTNLFEVRNGNGCYGNICPDDTVNLNGFIAYANGAGSCLVTRVPDGAPSVSRSDRCAGPNSNNDASSHTYACPYAVTHCHTCTHSNTSAHPCL